LHHCTNKLKLIVPAEEDMANPVSDCKKNQTEKKFMRKPRKKKDENKTGKKTQGQNCKNHF